MSGGIPATCASLERLLAALLKGGTWIASLTIATGLLLTLGQPHAHIYCGLTLSGSSIVTVGIGLFILLPVLRLALMLGVFLHRRDYRFSAVTALVLLIVLTGCAVGAHLSVSMPG
ncbi:DUF1634 domain-containing protein [Paraburkholderia sp.]|jgi:hypothetical protein|uniref:DUF1634 domain-containing protein n=1 Tax=Paraburkholderia sp. TaxID=1926495 RepID=UPI002F40CFE9